MQKWPYPAEASAEWREIEGLDPFSRLIGTLLERSGGQPGVFAIATDGRHLNANGQVHGGLLLSLADKSMGVAAWAAAGRQPVATVQVAHQFLCRVDAGDLVESRPSVTRVTRTLIFVTVALLVDGDVVCDASAVYSRRRAVPQS